jgi:hypothetical protein
MYNYQCNPNQNASSGHLGNGGHLENLKSRLHPLIPYLRVASDIRDV